MILLVLGSIAVLVGILLEDFSADTAIWILVLIMGFIWYNKSGSYIASTANSTLDELGKLKLYFVITWISAAAASVLLWEELGLDVLLGIVIGLVGTFLMNQFSSEAGSIIGGSTSSKSSAGSGTGNFCKNCGHQLETDSKFCKNCGEATT